MTQSSVQCSGSSAEPSQPNKTRVGYWLLAMVAGTVLTQVLNKQAEDNQPPGPARGDLSLMQTALPQQIGDWRFVSFEVQSPEQLPQGQFWWTHRWDYSNDDLSSTVTLDQANFMHWHDLTVCYQAIGWTVTDKRVIDGDNEHEVWPCVVAHLKKGGTESAMLVFSLFFDDGDPVNARDYEALATSRKDFGQLLGSRFEKKERRTSSVAGVRQCQVLVPYRGALDSETESGIVALHLQTREIFRDEWVNHWRATRP